MVLVDRKEEQTNRNCGPIKDCCKRSDAREDTINKPGRKVGA